jgi:hypothetical protein
LGMAPSNDAYNYVMNLATANTGSTASVTWDLGLTEKTSWVEFGYSYNTDSSLTVSNVEGISDYWALSIQGLDLGESSIYDDATQAIISSGTSMIYIS